MDATNGTTKAKLQDAKAKHRTARLAYETRVLEHQTKLLESWYYEDFATSDPWNRLRGPDSPFYRDEPPSHPGDRKHGESWPLYRTEIDLDRLRQQSRMLCVSNTFAKGLLRNLTNYTIGKGFGYKAQPGKKIDADAKTPGQQVPPEVEALVADVQDVIDEFCRENRWNCAADPLCATVQAGTREREGFRRVHRDGEAIFRLFFDRESGTTAVRFVEPEQVRQPVGATYADGWSFGIRHKKTADGAEDVETPEEYHVVYQDPTTIKDAAIGEFVPADEIVHVKHPDEDAAQKRGTPTFSFETLAALERASKLQRNSSLGAAVRAATAEVWKHNSATNEQITGLAANLRERTQENPATGKLESIERIRPGTIRRIDSGWEPVPYAPVTGVAEHGQAVQGDLRLASAAVCAPEYLTGDASNANYASTKEAGTPFVLSAEGEQEHFKAAYLAVIWRAVRWAAECGRLDKRALKMVEIQVEAPAVRQRDSLQKAQEDQILVGIGKSPQTVLMEAGLDPEVESTNVQEWQDKHGGMGGLGGLGLGGDDGGLGGGGGGGLGGLKLPGMESRALREGAEWDEDKHPRKGGKFASKGDGGGGKEREEQGYSRSLPTDADVAAIVQDKTLVQKIAGIPKAAVRKTVEFSRGLYSKAEEKYGPKWAKAILATAIVTMPTPFTLGSVAAMSGLAHLWTRYVSGGPKRKEGEVQESQEGGSMSAAEIQAIAKEWIEQLMGLHGEDETVVQESGGAEEEDPADPARLDAIADILGGIFGDDALEFLDQADLLEAWNPDDHPRGKGGRFIPRGSAEAVSTAKDAVRKALKGKRTPETTKQIMDHLSILTTKQLHDLKREYNLSASGKLKQDLVAKLADRLGRGRHEGPGDALAAKPKAKAKPKPMTLHKVILSKGGIDAAKLGSDWNVSEDFAQSGLLGVFRKGGTSLDDMAKILVDEGHLSVPSNRNADDYLLEKLQGRARSFHDTLESEIAADYAAYMRLEEDARSEHAAAEIEGAVRGADEAGREKGEAGPLEAGPGELADEEGAGEVGDFEFGANEEPAPETARAPGVSEQQQPPTAPAEQQGAGKKEPWEMTRGDWESMDMDGGKDEPSTSTIPSIDHSLISPAGRMSRRSREAAMNAEAGRIFAGISSLTGGDDKRTEYQKLRDQAARQREIAADLRRAGGKKNNLKADAREKKADELDALHPHRQAVETALASGKPVPPEVLADYPDLAAKYGEQPKDPASGLTKLPSGMWQSEHAEGLFPTKKQALQAAKDAIVGKKRDEPAPAAPAASAPIEQHKQSIRDAIPQLGGEMKRIHIADLHKMLPQHTPEEINAALLAMSDADELSLYKLDNPREIRPEDESAAIRTTSGQPRHIFWFGGQSGEDKGKPAEQPKPRMSDIAKQPRHPQHEQHAAKILQAFDAVGSQHNYATLADVRERSGLSRAEFDRAAVGLAQDGILTFGDEEGRGGVDPRIADAGIPGIGGSDKAATRMARRRS